ncbi:MAG: transcription-repair coupling factor [Ruminococcus sp.]|nr:transcription-repair coupling factor [Ruminococcus sp.]
MKFLDHVMQSTKGFATLSSTLSENSPCAVVGVSGVHKANIISSLCHFKNVRAFCAVENEQVAQTLCNDLCTMGLAACVYPTRDFTFMNIEGESHEYEHQRLNVLSKLIRHECDVVIACLDAFSQYTIPKEVLKKASLSLQSGDTVKIDELISSLLLLGYERTDTVEGVGQFAVRGGIVDLFMTDCELPVRIEFWGDEIDTINYFDPLSQRRTDYCEKILLTPSTEVLIEDKNALIEKIRKKASYLKTEKNAKAKEILLKEADMLSDNLTLSNIDKYITTIYEKPATLFDYLDDNALVFVSEIKATKERMKSFDAYRKTEISSLFEEGVLCRGFESYSLNYNECMNKLLTHPTVYLDTFSHGGYDTDISELINFSAKQNALFNGTASSLMEDFEEISYKDYAIVVLAGTKKAGENLAEVLSEKGYPARFYDNLEKCEKGKIHIVEGLLSSGIEYTSENFILYSRALTYSKSVKRRKTPKNAQQIYSLSDLSAGDYVVHSTHGIGLFKGIHKIDVQGVVKDYIKIEYAKGDMLYVPVTQLDLVAKYIGPREESKVKLNKLGSQDFQKAKSRVKSAVKDMAKELIVLYSQRMQAEGFAFSKDGEWQRDFETAFEFDETADQLRCCKEIKGDMERKAPMDRLLCGDVGFGKTEVALRAAFKCVSDSKQCAFLCPTTILAWQHYQTVLKRFDTYPVRVELLSRFRTKKQQEEILKKLKRGEIDMVIGTHRLVQKDVEFRDLGLVIIDEEQRFGVAHKERFKEVCKNVDVLTLSATPIPRTLNMAMSGIRDMSVIEEAPLDRKPVQTYVLEHDNAVINEAIRREIRRGGQVFYLHNNTETIVSKANKISAAIPEANVAVGHGKMSESELSDVWRKMLEQEVNVLVCTTIIETGVDLPNANTLIIENADRFGLSQLHQIRGRVGRSPRRAYAYFTFNGGKVLSEISTKRLNAIREFTEFGSGFKIAMRDLELRGAGNLLGAKQHGHMEDVGYDMYLKLLNDAVQEEKGEKSQDTVEKDCLIDVMVQAHIPEDYIENLSGRLDAYRRIADIRTKEDSLDVIDEFLDRYGDIPKSVMGLIDIALIRNKAISMGIYEIKQNENNILLYIDSIKREEVGTLISKLKGQAMLSATNKPYIAVRYKEKIDPLNALKEIFS